MIAGRTRCISWCYEEDEKRSSAIGIDVGKRELVKEIM